MAPISHAVRPATVRVVVTVAALAGGVMGGAVTLAPRMSAWSVLAVAASVAGAEAIRVTLPYRGGQVARFGQSDAVVLAGLVLLTPAEITVGACLGVTAWHVVDRLEPVKLVFNVAQFTISTAIAAFVYRALVPEGVAGARPDMLLPYALAATVFLVVSTALVGAVVATVVERGMVQSVRRLFPASAVVTAGGACLGLLALGVLDAHVYLLPTMGVPLLFVVSASRQQVEAQLQQERSHALVEYERGLGGARTAADVDHLLVEGIDRVVGAAAVVWRDGVWTAPPTDGRVLPSPPPRRPGDDDLPRLLGRTARTAVVVPVGGAAVVAWGGDLGVIDRTAEWIARLARSADDQVERTLAQAALLRERTTLRSVIDGTIDGIYLLDADDRLLLVNPALAALLGARADDLLGAPVDVALGPGNWTVPGVRDVEVSGSPTGATVWRVSVTALEDTGVDAVRVGVVHDVTAERRVARMKDDMLAVVSHELRTPLTPIRAAAQLLAARWDRVDAEVRGRLLGEIRDRADHLTKLVDDLLLVAQLSSEDGRAPAPVPAPVDVAAQLRADMAVAQDDRPDHRITFDGPASLPAVTDARRLRQIVDNLVDNACKFSPEGTAVRVALSRCDDGFRLTVTDRGRGIPADDVDRIFDRFERLEDPLVMRTSGAGLGLYIVRSLVRALGGTLAVTSTLGIGTTMTVTLPTTAEAADRALRAHADA